jgi:flagellar biosynthesis protein FlhG
MVTGLKSWREQNYYEILEVDPQATEEDIRIAYEKLRAMYSLITPGLTILFTPEEIKEIRDKMEEAYRVLRDPRSQREYDLMRQGAWGKPITPPPNPLVVRRTLDAQQIREALGGYEMLWSGENLGKIRRYLGLDIDALAVEIKISRHNLEAIEAEAMQALPATVYLKGFLRSYTKALGLDPNLVSEAYLARITEKGYQRE